MLRIAFRYKDRRLFARIICWWQRNDSAHCETVLSRNVDTYECASASFLDGGVRFKRMALPPNRWRIYEIPGDVESTRAWYVKHEGERYDILGLMGFVFRPIKGAMNMWFCSEAHAAAAMGVKDPYRYDVSMLESLCIRYGRRRQ